MKTPPRTLARRYARALIEVAAASRDAALPGRLRGELAELTRLLAPTAELNRTLGDPRLRPDTRRAILLAIARQAGGSELVQRLLELLALRDRLSLLPALAEAYAALLLERAGTLQAQAASAVPLAAAQRQALERALSAAVGKTVELETRIEPELVGGVLVRVAGRTFDGSVRSQLANLRRRLAAGG